ncbi:Feruloyl esterase B [Cladobotryum mycophilum]|uniref:feruloyl esterase n=1 Tax=Cladobotryum mycophilum TaxID=491253 RepID=A0ABR0SPY6_9HYPO
MVLLGIALIVPVLAVASRLPKSPLPHSATGCAKVLPKGQSVGKVYNVTIPSGDGTRSLLISIPPSYNSNAPAPLILSYHGGDRDATDQLQLDEFTNPAFNSNSYVVYPQGIKDTWQGVPDVTANDIQFTTDILDYVQSQYCIDTTRIFATGKSDGGGFCNVLACDPTLSSRIAAFAPVSGAFYIDSSLCMPSKVDIPCKNSRSNIPFLEFHGGNDSTIPYKGGPDRGSVFQPSHTSSNRLNTGLVEHIYDSVIGHDWPSTAPNADNQRPDHHVASFNATPIVLEFFKQNFLNSRELK